jgi:thiol-disulfide isomerase/thioredoxin
VVLLDFWTYSCVNCVRTFPYLKEWHQKYGNQGLVIIGVHTPEFQFEKVKGNVAEAAATHGLEYPIALDNDYATWNAFFNDAWPAKYLIDQKGDLRYRHLGEGAYAETEQAIRDLLVETGADLTRIAANLSTDPAADRQAYSIDLGRGITRELYAGYNRNQTLPSTAFATLMGDTPSYIMAEDYYQQRDAEIFYVDPGDHLNHFIYLQGLWGNGPESITHARATQNFEDYVAIKFYATSVNAVLSGGEMAPLDAGDAGSGADPPTSGPAGVVLRVTLDGKPLTRTQAGQDLRFDDAGNSFVLVDEPRLYGLVRLEQFSSHELRLGVMAPNLSLFSFTFGAYEDGV